MGSALRTGSPAGSSARQCRTAALATNGLWGWRFEVRGAAAFEPSVRALGASHYFGDLDALWQEGLLHGLQCLVGVGLAAGEEVQSGVAVLRPGMDGDVGF